MTAQDIVKRLEELKVSLEENDNLSHTLNEQHNKLTNEYDNLKEQLLTLI